MDHGLDAMVVVNVLASVLLMAAGVGLLLVRRRGPQTIALAAFLGLTGAAWTILFAAEEAAERDVIGSAFAAGATVVFTVFLAGASAALVIVALRHVGSLRARWIAAVVASLTALIMFVGRGASATFASSDAVAVAARAARDSGIGAFVFALVLFTLGASEATISRKAKVLAFSSGALLLYPGIVAGIYLHPDSHRNMAGLAATLALVSILWLINTRTDEPQASRGALIVALLALALPLLALATVRVQGGIEVADAGPLRALARTAGPLLFAYVLVRGEEADPDSSPVLSPRSGGR